MNPLERREHIMQRLQQDGKASLDELARELAVSTMTVRRDIRALTSQGLATVSVGTVYWGSKDSNAALQGTAAQNEQAMLKQAISKAAAELIDDGDTIIVDCGTTTCELLRYIGSKKLTIITNSIPVAELVGANPNVRLIYAPGEYSLDSRGMVGPLAEEFFQNLKVDKAFLGAHGFDAVGGVNEPVLGDATAKRAMLAVATKSYLLVDSSKYGNVHFRSMNKLLDYGCVITDNEFPSEKRAELEACCNQVMYAS